MKNLFMPIRVFSRMAGTGVIDKKKTRILSYQVNSCDDFNEEIIHLKTSLRSFDRLVEPSYFSKSDL